MLGQGERCSPAQSVVKWWTRSEMRGRLKGCVVLDVILGTQDPPVRECLGSMTVINNSGQFLSIHCRKTFWAATHRGDAGTTLCQAAEEWRTKHYRPQRKNVHRALRIQGNGGQSCSGQLALEVNSRMGGIEFIVLNVFFFQSNFSIGLISNSIYIQIPNSIINVS